MYIDENVEIVDRRNSAQERESLMIGTYSDYLKTINLGSATTDSDSDFGSDLLKDNTLTQSQFSTTYSAWLQSVFSDSNIKTWLQSKGINTDGAISVDIAQNSASVLPGVSYAGVAVSQSVLNELFTAKDNITLINGKTTQERYYVTGFEQNAFQSIYAPKATLVTANATEDGPSATVSALAGITDVDTNINTLAISVGTLPPGVVYDAVSKSFTLDPSHTSFQSLASGEAKTVTVTYGVSDSQFNTTATIEFTVTGTNDAPVITSSAANHSGSVTEDGTLSATGQITSSAVSNTHQTMPTTREV
jgi:VCBS repeat-containing protein